MNWCRQHLNWTWIIVFLLGFITVLFDSPIPYTIWAIFFYIVSFWVLHEKGRGWGWIFIPIAIPFLANERKKRYPPAHHRDAEVR